MGAGWVSSELEWYRGGGGACSPQCVGGDGGWGEGRRKDEGGGGEGKGMEGGKRRRGENWKRRMGEGEKGRGCRRPRAKEYLSACPIITTHRGSTALSRRGGRT